MEHGKQFMDAAKTAALAVSSADSSLSTVQATRTRIGVNGFCGDSDGFSFYTWLDQMEYVITQEVARTNPEYTHREDELIDVAEQYLAREHTLPPIFQMLNQRIAGQKNIEVWLNYNRWKREKEVARTLAANTIEGQQQTQ